MAGSGQKGRLENRRSPVQSDDEPHCPHLRELGEAFESSSEDRPSVFCHSETDNFDGDLVQVNLGGKFS